MKREDIFTKSRKQAIVQVRQVAMYLAQKYTKLSSARIGALVGNRNHATVLYSSSTVQTLYKGGDPETATALKALVEKLGRTTGDLN